MRIGIIAAAALLAGCATGSHIITGDTREALPPELVTVYYHAPKEYEVIGLVEAASETAFSPQAAQDRVIERLRQEAAQLGANGVLLTATDTEVSRSGITLDITDDGQLGFFELDEVRSARAEAIFVIQP